MTQASLPRASSVLLSAGVGHALAGTPRLRYGGDAAFAPFESLDAAGRPVGFQIDPLSELRVALGITFDIALKPWAQTESDFQQGRLDVVAMVDTPHRRQWARFTRGHATPSLAVYHRRDRAATQGLTDLVGLRIAVLDGEAMRDTLANWLHAVPGPFVHVADAGQALAAVQQGRADVALLPRAYAEPLLAPYASSDPSGITASPINLPLQTYAFGVAPAQEALQAQLQQGLDGLEASGRLEALRVSWLSSHRSIAERAVLELDLAKERGWNWGVAGISGAALLLMGSGLWLRGRRIATERSGRARAEAALQQAQALLEHTFLGHADPMLIVERGSGVVRDANPALMSLLGLPADQLIGSPLRSLGRHVDPAAMQPLVQLLDEEGALVALPLSVRSADGDQRECLVSADPLLIDSVAHVFCIVRDIGDRLADEAALRRGYESLTAQLARAQDEADAAKERRDRAENALSEFTRGVAHDLKAPVNAMQGFAGLLRERLQSGRAQEAVEYLDHIDRAAQRMTAMIAALARLGQVSQQTLQRQTVDMAQLARDSGALIAAARPERRTALQVAALPTAQAAPDLAAQVWQNLLDNAAKYSARVAEAKVAVDSFADDRGTWYRVTDNGVGFDRDKAQRLFQPFARMHSSQQFEGTGVGLSLVQRIVDHHGGEIRVRSAPGVGTVVEFTLDAPRV